MQLNECFRRLQGQLYRPLRAIKAQIIDHEALPKEALKPP